MAKIKSKVIDELNKVYKNILNLIKCVKKLLKTIKKGNDHHEFN